VTNNHVGETGLGLHLKTTTQLAEGLRMVVGLREDHVDMRMTAAVQPLNSGHAQDSMASPKLALIFGPWARTEFFVAAGRGFHSNDARGVIDKIDPTTGDAASPVPALVAARGSEVGLRTEAIPGLQSSLSLWRLDSDSEIIYSADSAIGSTEPNGASKRYGVEWNNHYHGLDWLWIDADLAWTHARYAQQDANGSPGDLIPNAIPKVARVGVSVRDLGPWAGMLELRYFSAYPLTQDGTLTAPSALVANLRLERSITASADLSLDVLNLFNRKYYDIAYEQDFQAYASSAAVPSGVTVHPGEPRQLRLTLRWKF